uniref:Uncharacterized protein n=1 Tax=Chromera velia CCMP2878 TaxID=1169474 RepID=A0A0G4I9K8_9ALVE|eukprot:Cvel_12185.t1-p1 / transcript=Cvel_12185.t1 / gene=Cvel_12185 / organism=Chromera_velia_CCMP2878 / gene_product=LIMR family protein DDB_G0283707, putative / transcript_product=LIMR family protein DDB_G0283707, putative / location=Cvel_scaffold787:23723-28299(-) / protein_length=581 / sequence_SO=supercontig / SO=protein_coding / is_pseudo=false
MDLFLLFSFFIVVGLFILADIKIIYAYEHPDDAGFAGLRAVFSKMIVLVGILIAQIMVLLLPMDVYNARPGLALNVSSIVDYQRPGGFQMDVFWIIMYTLAIFWLVFLYPFTMTYYAAEDDSRFGTKYSPVVSGLIRASLTLFLIGVLVGPLYFWIGKGTFEFDEIACGSSVVASDSGGDRCATVTALSFEFMARFDIYLVGIVCFIGWFLFVLFGGIGLTAVPMDLILSFIDRPKPVDIATFGQRKRTLGETARKLQEAGADLKVRDANLKKDGGGKGWLGLGGGGQRAHRKLQRDFNKFQQAVYVLEREWAHLDISMKRRGENPVVSVGKLILGILAGCLSIMWWLHILLFMIIRTGPGRRLPVTPFLNSLLWLMDQSGVFIISLAMYATLVFYLLTCVIKGCFKFGMRIFLFFPIHPMEPHNTHCTSFLFNTAMLLLSSTAVIQFSQSAFSDYARLTDAELIFSTLIRRLTFLGWIYTNDIFVYVLFGWSFVTLIYLLIRPRDKPADVSDFAKASEHEQLQAMAKMEKNAEKAARQEKKEKARKEREEKRGNKGVTLPDTIGKGRAQMMGEMKELGLA